MLLLPVQTRSQLRSSQILTSLVQVVSELVQNSLDAGARHVGVGVDTEGWSCWVRDDGVGLSIEGMALLAKGSEEGRYGSSKAYTAASLDVLSTFGFRGEALASAADLCCLEVSSRTAKSNDTWSVILKGGEKLYYGPAIRWRRESPGTVVCIRDAFYNLPIRRLSHPNPVRTVELIRKELETYALVFPNVAFSLENSAKEKENGKGRITTINQTTSPLAAFRQLYGRALAEHAEEINASSGDIRIRGFLSSEGAHSKHYQFLYVNKHPLDPCQLHRVIENKFAASSFGKHAYDEDGKFDPPQPSQRRSPRKTERRPVFVLNIELPPRSLDICLEPTKASVQFENSELVTSFLSSIIQSFLVRHGFSTTHSNQDDADSPSKKRRRVSEPDDDFQEELDTPKASSLKRRSSIPLYAHTNEPDDDDAQLVNWTDPSTGETFIVDTRTGNSFSRDHDEMDEDGPRGYVDRRSLRNLSERKGEKGEKPAWIEEALEGWDNPVFDLTESDIPSVSFIPEQSQTGDRFDSTHAHFRHSNYFDPNRRNLENASRRFTKEDLKSARVINQVDNKFVACVIGGVTDSVVLIDQHAADERIRVEMFLEELCGDFLRGCVKRRELVGSDAKKVLLTRLEVEKIEDVGLGIKDAFERWGVRIGKMEGNKRGEEYVQVLVESVPDVVGDKLLLGDELKELIKGYLGKLESEGIKSWPSDLDEDAIGRKDDWLRALPWCPRELLDLVNSKACRGAIMFNDPLSMDQCERLVVQLAETVFPFQCAHGRPSLAPLISLKGSSTARKNKMKDNELDWSTFTL